MSSVVKKTCITSASDIIVHQFEKKWCYCLSDIDEDSVERKKSMLSCKRLKEAHTNKVLAKKLKTLNWVFGIENKIVNTNSDCGSNFVKAFNV